LAIVEVKLTTKLFLTEVQRQFETDESFESVLVTMTTCERYGFVGLKLRNRVVQSWVGWGDDVGLLRGGEVLSRGLGNFDLWLGFGGGGGRWSLGLGR
jgi:hypothetical protein